MRTTKKTAVAIQLMLKQRPKSPPWSQQKRLGTQVTSYEDRGMSRKHRMLRMLCGISFASPFLSGWQLHCFSWCMGLPEMRNMCFLRCSTHYEVSRTEAIWLFWMRLEELDFWHLSEDVENPIHHCVVLGEFLNSYEHGMAFASHILLQGHLTDYRSRTSAHDHHLKVPHRKK